MQGSCNMASIRAAIRRAHREHPPGLRGDPHPCLFPRAVMRRRPAVRYVPFPLVTGHRHVERPTYWQEGKPRDAVARGYYALDAPYLMDDHARRFVRDNPEGASLADVAEALRIGKSTAGDIEQRAFGKLRARAKADRTVRRWLVDLAYHIGMHAVAEEYQGHA